MRVQRIIQLTLLTITAGFALLPLFASVEHPQPLISSFDYQSELGEHIGNGESKHYTPAEADFDLTGTEEQITFSLKGKQGYWQVSFTAPKGQALHIGHYSTIEPSVYKRETLPLLSVISNGAECNSAFGQFTLHHIKAETSGKITQLHASFVLRCETSTSPSLQGQLYYNAPVGQ